MIGRAGDFGLEVVLHTSQKFGGLWIKVARGTAASRYRLLKVFKFKLYFMDFRCAQVVASLLFASTGKEGPSGP